MVRDNRWILAYRDADGSRRIEDLTHFLAILLFHELAHAVDYMPSGEIAGLSLDQKPYQVVDARLSRSVLNAYPLASQVMKDLAKVSFHGTGSTATQRALEPDDLIDEFAPDGATQYYSYSTVREDFATLFDNVMMRFTFGIARDVGITDVPASGVRSDAWWPGDSAAGSRTRRLLTAFALRCGGSTQTTRLSATSLKRIWTACRHRSPCGQARPGAQMWSWAFQAGRLGRVPREEKRSRTTS